MPVLVGGSSSPVNTMKDFPIKKTNSEAGARKQRPRGEMHEQLGERGVAGLGRHEGWRDDHRNTTGWRLAEKKFLGGFQLRRTPFC